MSERVSIIIPTYNESSNLAAAIASVRTDPDVEVIVADGGSDDGTLGLAHELADAVVSAPRNRAGQLNAGARIASGSWLLFLHADSVLSPAALPALRAAIANDAVVGGAFRLHIGDRLGLRVITWGTNFRARWFKLPYGDQALFARAAAFHELDGYRPLEIMEDVDFVRRLRRIGRLTLVDAPVQTSSRRWETHGLVRTTFANSSALALFKLGVAPQRIRRYYDSLVSRHDIRAT